MHSRHPTQWNGKMYYSSWENYWQKVAVLDQGKEQVVTECLPELAEGAVSANNFQKMIWFFRAWKDKRGWIERLTDELFIELKIFMNLKRMSRSFCLSRQGYH